MSEDQAISELVDLEQFFSNQHLSENAAGTSLDDFQGSTLQLGQEQLDQIHFDEEQLQETQLDEAQLEERHTPNVWKIQSFDPSLPFSVPFTNPFSLQHQGNTSFQEFLSFLFFFTPCFVLKLTGHSFRQCCCHAESTAILRFFRLYTYSYAERTS